MATSKILGFLESRKNLTGCAFGLAGLGLTFTGLAGTYWPVVVAGLYGAGALIAPPDRPTTPDFAPPPEQLEELRRDFAALTDYLTEVSLPPPAAARLTDLTDLITSLLDPGWVADAPADGPGGRPPPLPRDPPGHPGIGRHLHPHPLVEPPPALGGPPGTPPGTPTDRTPRRNARPGINDPRVGDPPPGVPDPLPGGPPPRPVITTPSPAPSTPRPSPAALRPAAPSVVRQTHRSHTRQAQSAIGRPVRTEHEISGGQGNLFKRPRQAERHFYDLGS